jgi:uncharacterized protein
MKPLPSDTQLAACVRSAVPEVQGAWLFGSAAHHQLRAQSDVDIAVWQRQPMSAVQRFDAAQALAAILGRDVDLLDFHRLSTLMQAQIINTGRRLFTDDPVAELNTIAMVLRDYQDLQIRRRPMLRGLHARLQQAGA